jgi:lysophospholipid acyltransferase (LPLAT)-like uncharacterized protein
VKKLLQHEPAQRILGGFLAAYSRLAYRLTRWTRVNDAALLRWGDSGRPFVVCFWHGRMALMPNFWRFRMPLYLLGSPHRDGRLMAQVLARFGARSIVGSSSQRGMRAMREMVRAVRGGSAICITPDGPRGPRMRAMLGPIALAKITGVPIYPISLSTTRGRTLDSWDRLLLAYPFGRGVFIVGEPVEVSRDADDAALEAARLTLERRLNEITAEADRRCGRTPVEPEPAASPAERAA